MIDLDLAAGWAVMICQKCGERNEMDRRFVDAVSTRQLTDAVAPLSIAAMNN